MHPLVLRFLDAYKNLGFSKMLRIGPRWLVHRKYLVIVRDLSHHPPEVPTHKPMHFTTLAENEISQVSTITPSMSEAEVRRRWGEGQECFLSWIGGILASYRWAITRPAFLPYLGKTFRPLEGDILAGPFYIHPAFRGGGIYTVLNIMAMHRAYDDGFSRTIAVLAWWNAPSLKVNQLKTGGTVVGTVGYWDAGLWRRYFASGDVCLDDDTSFYVRPQVLEVSPPSTAL